MDLRLSISLLTFIFAFQCGLLEGKDAIITNGTNSSNVSVHHSEMFKVVDWKFNSLKNYFIYTFFIIIVILMKIIYFHIPNLAAYIPESCILVMIGVIFGVIIKFSVTQDIKYFKLTTHLFFSILLPPIILESSYSLFHRNFLENFLSILVFAVFGTLLNFLLIGLSLWGLAQFGAMVSLKLDLIHCLLFSSLIVAVDPVAVLAIFQDVGVNPDLYYLVFGESLLNDAVTVVLYEMMQEFAMMPEIGATNIFLGFISFFTVSIGGMLIGIIVGILSCLIIRGMVNETLILEPILLMSTGYLSYLCGDVFGWSGIISTTACGLIQASYAFYRISDKSRMVLKRFVKILAAICEALIFLFLGVELVVGKLEWNSAFSFTVLFLCLIVRFIVTFILSGIVNRIHMNMRNIPLREKIIISYGGLRGAVAFSLAILVKSKSLPTSGINEEIIITTTLFIILFTIFVQGITVKPLVKFLKITRKEECYRMSLLDELNDSINEAAICGVNSILGTCRQSYIFMLFEKVNGKYLRPILQGKASSSYSKIVILNEKINNALIHGLNESPSCHNMLKQLPNSYINLSLLLTNQNKPKRRPSVKIVSKPLLRHSQSDSIEYLQKKDGQRLSNILFRVQSITDEENSHFAPHNPSHTLQRLANVIVAKDRFLNFRRSQREEKKMCTLNKIMDGDEDEDNIDDENSL